MDRDLKAESDLSQELITLAESMTPDVEATGPDLVLLDMPYRGTPYLQELRTLNLEGMGSVSRWRTRRTSLQSPVTVRMCGIASLSLLILPPYQLMFWLRSK